jgi:small-conductance mechanosensitive channel
VTQWGIAAGIAALCGALLWAGRGWSTRALAARARRTGHELDALLADLARRTRAWFVAAAAVYAGTLALALGPQPSRLLGIVIGLAALLQVVVWGNAVIAVAIGGYVRGRMEAGDGSSATTASVLSFLARLGLWTIALLLALDNLGVDVTALIAGLGVGGIAVALALQSVLGDIFAAFAIMLDKPFRIGDFIVVGDLLGTVEHVGLKTTRLRSLSGEQLIFSNRDLLDSRIRNFKRMQERRVLFGFGVTYDTAADRLAEIPALVRAIIERQPLTRFDRAHFKAFGASSLDFEVVYYVLTADYNTHMDLQQAINLELCREFARQGIEFAYPTQTLYMRRPGARVEPAISAGRP